VFQRKMLLSPTASNGVSKKDNIIIKEALFEFFGQNKTKYIKYPTLFYFTGYLH